MNRIHFSLLSLAALCLAPLRLAAGDGRIPLSFAPYNITAPGNYYLTRDITTASSGFFISVSDVTLDLNGHTITSSDSSATANTTGVSLSNNSSRVRVFNGSLQNFRFGVSLSYSVNAEGLEFRGLRIGVNQTTTVTVAGFSLFVPAANVLTHVIIADNQVVTAKQNGLSLYGLNDSVVSGNLVFNTQASPTTGLGISCSNCNQTAIAGNQVSGFQNGIYISLNAATSTGVRVSENLVSATNTGINNFNSLRCVMVDNQVIDSVGAGFSVAANLGTVWARNVANGNGTNYSIGAGNVSAGNNCDNTVCTR